MPDPICRWRNPYFKTVRELIDLLPKKIMPKQEARGIVTGKEAGFYQTAYQLACQLGLYYEEDDIYYPRFTSTPTIKQIQQYSEEWFLNYYTPNPYTNGFDGITPLSLHSELCKALHSEPSDTLKMPLVLQTLFKEKIGNDDIINNALNQYSPVLQWHKSSNELRLKDGIVKEDLPKYIKDIGVKDRSNKRQFFETISQLVTENISSKTTAENTIYYGSPGTGKSYEVTEITKKARALDPKRVEQVTFHPEYDYHSFVGSYKPTMIKDQDTGEKKISYEFIPQAFTNIYVNAWKDQGIDNIYYLQIEEINRGNCAEIFGDLFQLLDRNPDYIVSADHDLKTYLIEELGEEHPGIKEGKLLLPPNLNIIATMNTSDQSLFPMDSAFKRRWDWVFTPIKYEHDCTDKSKEYIVEIGENRYNWLHFLKAINLKIYEVTESQDKQIGNWFIKPNDSNAINVNSFVNKVIFYLWNDVFKDEDENNIFKVSKEKALELSINNGHNIITFEQFFENGGRNREVLLQYLFNEVLELQTLA